MKNPVQPRILVVDDEPALREVMTMELELHGFQVFSASSGMEAYELIVQHDIPTVVSDIRMPDGGGLALLRRIQEHNHTSGKQVRVVLMTGFAGVARDDVKERGALDLLMKPFLMDELMKVISLTSPRG